MSPELATDPRFATLWIDIKFRKNVDRVCIDEAHCITQWGKDFRSSYLRLSNLYHMLGDDVPFFLTSATLRHNVLVEIMKVLGVSDSIPVKRRSNDRPNIHLCVRPMEHTLGSCFDIAFLVPLDAQIDNREWIEANISPFLLYCNSHADTLKTARFLRTRLPAVARNRIVWYHSGMSEAFKEEVVDAFEAGQIWGVCCTDACGMVSVTVHIDDYLAQYS